MKTEELPDCTKWYIEQAAITCWSLRNEMIKYWRAAVDVLSRAVLVFRKTVL